MKHKIHLVSASKIFSLTQSNIVDESVATAAVVELFLSLVSIGVRQSQVVGLPYFEKQKSGHWMTNFHETKFMAPPTFFSSKAGRWDAVAGLIVEATVQIWNHRRKLGWSPKKKKKKCHRLLVQRFVSFLSPKVEKCCYRAGVDLFFFFWRSPQFLSLLSELHPCLDNQVCNRISPSRFGWRINWTVHKFV